MTMLRIVRFGVAAVSLLLMGWSQGLAAEAVKPVKAAPVPTDKKSTASASGAEFKASRSALAYLEEKNVIYGEVDGIALVMNVFKPAKTKNGIAIIDVASGAWHSDRGKIEDHRRAGFYDIFCGRGYTVFAIRPGSVSKFSVPEMVRNLRTGIRWVRSHAAEYGIDPDNMGISGASAGGHLACLTVITTAGDSDGKIDQPFKAAGVFFPPTDFLAWGGFPIDYTKEDRLGRMIRGLIAYRNNDPSQPIDKADLTEQVRKISPARLVDRKQPPFLIFHGDADPMVPLQQSQVLVEALKKAGGSAELIVKPGGRHPWPTIPEEVKLMADWFDKQLKPKHAS